MRVALVLNSFDVQRGGAERSTYEMAVCLSELGVEVTIVAGKITGDTGSYPFGLRSLRLSGWSRVARMNDFSRRMAALAEEKSFDIIHSMVPLEGIDVYQPRGGSVLFGQRRHAASYACPYARFGKQLTGGLNRSRQWVIRAEREVCQASKKPVVAALSRYVQSQFQELYGPEDHRLRLIPNGIDPAPFRSEQARVAGAALRKLYDRQGDLALLVFAAANYRLKGLQELIVAAEKAHRQRTTQRDIRIMVVGNENYSSYWQQAMRAGLNGRVIFLGPTEEMPALLNMADAVVLPTYNDACSRLVLESLAAGKPAITTRFNGAADFLGEGKYGVVVSAPTVGEELAAALLAVCDADRHRSMCQAIEADRLYEQVSMRRHARQLLTLYQELAG